MEWTLIVIPRQDSGQFLLNSALPPFWVDLGALEKGYEEQLGSPLFYPDPCSSSVSLLLRLKTTLGGPSGMAGPRVPELNVVIPP